MMNDQTYLTAEGAARLRAELTQLKGTGREELAKRLRAAIQEGDLSENADYSKAKEDQAFLEGRIQELERVLRDAIIIEVGQGKHDKVEVGARVTVKEEGLDDLEDTYLLVGAKEAKPREGKISNESPLGRALMGARQGDIVTAETPNGLLRFKVIKIE